MKQKWINLVVAWVILFASAALWALPSFAQAQTVHIFTVDDLRALSKNCSFDKWSKDKKVFLENDIDLNGETFTPIPIFKGHFDGKGYTVCGLLVEDEGSTLGFFRYLGEGALVKNLNVKGVLNPGGDKNFVGGLVGKNSGILENCSFQGYVEGKEAVGGLVGKNQEIGVVSDCVFQGIVYGKAKVGGVAGINSGTMLRVLNDSSVNTKVEEYKLDLEELKMDDLNPLRPFIDAMDIGGVAGLNTGILRDSENKGAVGYPHVGYNIGGIAGRQSGYINGCSNSGFVCGRKDVAGIVGQFEPYISATVDKSGVRELQNEVSNLKAAIDSLLKSLDDASSAAHYQMSALEKSLESVKDGGQSLVNSLEALMNKDISEINRISAVAKEAMDRLVPVLDTLGGAVQKLARALPPLERALHYLSRGLGKLPEFSDEYAKLADKIDRLTEKVLDSGDFLDDTLSFLTEVLDLLYAGDLEGARALLGEAHTLLERARQFTEEAIEIIQKAQNSVVNIVGIAGEIGSDVGRALSNLEDAVYYLEKVMVDIPKVILGISDVLDFLARQPPLEFETTDDDFQKIKDGFFGSLGDLLSSFSLLKDVLKDEESVLLRDIQNVSNSLFRVIDLSLEMVGKIGEGEISPEKMFEDISRYDAENQTQGKVQNCTNAGKIEGDINVGGIAGAMAIEFLTGGEEDFSVGAKPSLKTVFKTRAAMAGCENQGDILGKKDCVGGIVGNMDLGYVKNCVSCGDVESTDGHYVGGIAGKSLATIDTCNVKGTLYGGNYLGGIAGFGHEILDSCAIVTIPRCRAYKGAIAGDVGKGSVLKGNYFVSDTLCGVDGISYEGKAEPLNYSDLMRVCGDPEIFKNMRVVFLADGETAGVLELPYGENIGEEDVPDFPTKEGYYGRWQNLNIGGVTADQKIRAEYLPYICVLESRCVKEGGLPLVLVEGQFTDEDDLQLEEIPLDGDFPEGWEGLGGWALTIPNDGEEGHRIRLLGAQNSARLAVFFEKDGRWVKIRSEPDGKYLAFESQGTFIRLALAKKHNLALAIKVFGALSICVPLFFLARRKKVYQ